MAASPLWADSLDRSFADWAEPGDPLPPVVDARALSLQFLEWGYLADWVRSEIAGSHPGEIPGKWARLCSLRTGDAQSPAWELERRTRGLCLFEDLQLADPALLLFCDSLLTLRREPVNYLFAGLLEARLLSALGLSGCGREGDAASALIASLDGVPHWNLDALKEDRDYAALFFAAERVVEAYRRERLGRVREFLARPGQLISLKYGRHAPKNLSPNAEPEMLDSEHWYYPTGLFVEWEGGHSLDVREAGVLHMPGQHLFQVVEPSGVWRLEADGKYIATPEGSFELDGHTTIHTDHLRIELADGRYQLDAVELRLWLPAGFLATNRRELLFTLFLIVTIVYLLGNVRRQRRKLAEPLTIRRPRRPR